MSHNVKYVVYITTILPTPNPMKLGRFVKRKIKTEYNDMQIMYNLCSIEYTTKTRYVMFKIINFMLNVFFGKYSLILY